MDSLGQPIPPLPSFPPPEPPVENVANGGQETRAQASILFKKELSEIIKNLGKQLPSPDAPPKVPQRLPDSLRPRAPQKPPRPPQQTVLEDAPSTRGSTREEVLKSLKVSDIVRVMKEVCKSKGSKPVIHKDSDTGLFAFQAGKRRKGLGFTKGKKGGKSYQIMEHMLDTIGGEIPQIQAKIQPNLSSKELAALHKELKTAESALTSLSKSDWAQAVMKNNEELKQEFQQVKEIYQNLFEKFPRIITENAAAQLSETKNKLGEHPFNHKILGQYYENLTVAKGLLKQAAKNDDLSTETKKEIGALKIDHTLDEISKNKVIAKLADPSNSEFRTHMVGLY
ncbi:MAG: hypothetical protein WB791_11435, partial [Waddliaceae bacterium]